MELLNITATRGCSYAADVCFPYTSAALHCNRTMQALAYDIRLDLEGGARLDRQQLSDYLHTSVDQSANLAGNDPLSLRMSPPTPAYAYSVGLVVKGIASIDAVAGIFTLTAELNVQRILLPAGRDSTAEDVISYIYSDPAVIMAPRDQHESDKDSWQDRGYAFECSDAVYKGQRLPLKQNEMAGDNVQPTNTTKLTLNLHNVAGTGSLLGTAKYNEGGYLRSFEMKQFDL